MTIGGIEGSSFVDYPRMLSCVFFTQGCNYDCFYCHNRSLIGPGTGIISYQEVDRWLEKRKHMLDAVVFSGGEPTLHPDLASYVYLAKEKGYKTKLDTNGSRSGVVSSLLEKSLLTYVALDVKAPKSRYRELGGLSADYVEVYKSLALLTAFQKEHPWFSYEVRTTLAPLLYEEDLISLASELPPLMCWRLNYYRKPLFYKQEDAEKIHLPSLQQREVERIAHTLLQRQPNLRLD